MSELKDLLIGFTQPLRDLIASFILYLVFTSGITIESTISPLNGHIFNIWIFMDIFISISIFDNFMGIVSDVRTTYDNPVDAFARFIGLFIGSIVWGFALVTIYVNMRGDLGDILVFVLVATVCLIGGFILRLIYPKRRR